MTRARDAKQIDLETYVAETPASPALGLGDAQPVIDVPDPEDDSEDGLGAGQPVVDVPGSEPEPHDAAMAGEAEAEKPEPKPKRSIDELMAGIHQTHLDGFADFAALIRDHPWQQPDEQEGEERVAEQRQRAAEEEAERAAKREALKNGPMRSVPGVGLVRDDDSAHIRKLEVEVTELTERLAARDARIAELEARVRELEEELTSARAEANGEAQEREHAAELDAEPKPAPREVVWRWKQERRGRKPVAYTAGDYSISPDDGSKTSYSYCVTSGSALYNSDSWRSSMDILVDVWRQRRSAVGA